MLMNLDILDHDKMQTSHQSQLQLTNFAWAVIPEVPPPRSIVTAEKQSPHHAAAPEAVSGSYADAYDDFVSPAMAAELHRSTVYAQGKSAHQGAAPAAVCGPYEDTYQDFVSRAMAAELQRQRPKGSVLRGMILSALRPKRRPQPVAQATGIR